LTLLHGPETRICGFAGVFEELSNGMAVVGVKATAKGCESPYSFVLAPSNAARGNFPGSPLAPPIANEPSKPTQTSALKYLR
jgi:hypothetical protein